MTKTLAVERVGFAISLEGVAGRQLIAGDVRDSVRSGLIVHRDRLTVNRELSTEHLLADVRGAGNTLAQSLLRQFGLDLPDSALIDLQQRVFGT